MLAADGCALSCPQYRNLVVASGCKCGYSQCCQTSIIRDSRTGLTGVKFEFNRPIKYDGDTMDVYICVKGTSQTTDGLIGYYGVGTFAYSCDHYSVPQFCRSKLFYFFFLHFICVHILSL